MAKLTKREKDAELARQFLEQIGWDGEFYPAPGIDQGTLDRFWSKFRVSDGHWMWTRSTSLNDVGQFAVTPHILLKTHRLAWMLLRGEIEPGMALVREDCEHPECGNPDHHRKVSETEARSMGGRAGGRGNVKSQPKRIPVNCSQDAVNLLCAMNEQGRTLREIHHLGLRLGLGPMTIQHIIKGNAVGVR